MYLQQGFYYCPSCAKVHTYVPGPIHVECPCGARINQFDLTYTKN